MSAISDARTPGPGLAALRADMARQFVDGLRTLDEAAAPALAAAQSLRRTGRLLLLGMGASHWVGRAVEPLYRLAGVDATAQALSEYQHAPIVPRPRTVMLTSQSGASGEVVRYLADHGSAPGAVLPDTFGLTLDPASPLAQATAPLVGAGGTEAGFAATRSLVVTLALHAAVLGHLGQSADALWAVLARAATPVVPAAIDALAGCTAAVFSSRGLLQGVADVASLTFMELGRLPVLALEGGQFRHGPMEILGPAVASVLLRPRHDADAAVARLAGACVAAGSPTIVFDLSEAPPVPGAVMVPLAPADGLAAAVSALTGLQAAIVAAACRRVERVGEPVRSSKVTDGR